MEAIMMLCTMEHLH